MRRLLMVLLMLGLAGSAMASTTTGTNLGVKPAGNYTYAPPANPRQGGDTIANAIVIGALPYSDTGTTDGNMNDYDEVCPYTSSQSPDVVYSYTPTVAQQNITVSLCYSSYDTKVYIYQNAQGNLIACNDDFYFAAPCYTYSSAVEYVAVASGNTYYIVVDGCGSASGAYALNVTDAGTPPPTGACCAPSGICTMTVEAQCLNPSIWHPEWTTCDPLPYGNCPVPPPTGACCDPSTGACTITTQAQCTVPMVWHPEWTTCSPNPCRLSFCGLDSNLDGVFTSNTDWGVVDLTFTGSDSILYFNLTVNESWQVQDVPVLTLHGVGTSQTQRFWFDLGNEIGVNVDHLHYCYALTPAPLGAPPACDIFTAVGKDTIVVSSGFEGESLGPTLPAARPTVGGGAAAPVQHRHQYFLNQQCQSGECVPTAISNSLQFLNRVHDLGMAADDMTIDKMKTATKWTATTLCYGTHDESRPAGHRNAWWEDKADYMRKHHLPIATRKFDRKDIGKLIDEIDAGQDIEARFVGHALCIVGLTDLGGGRYTVTVAEDDDQGNDDDPTVETPGTWNSNTGTWEGGSPSAGGSDLDYFVVECPRETDSRTHSSGTDPGTSRPPAAPWVLVEPGGVNFPGALGDKIWLAKNNLHVPQNEKVWTIVLTGPDADKYSVNAVHGYVNMVPVSEAPVHAVTSIRDTPGPPKQRTITVRLKPQPDWEVIEIVRTEALAGGERANIRVRSYTNCFRTSRTRIASTFSVDGGWFGVLGDTLRITEVMIFPDNVPVDPTADQTFITDPQFGDWFHEIVYEDPWGEPRPQGGVRWYTSGIGLGPEDDYSLDLVMDGPVDTTYSCYAYDVESGEYQFYKLTVDAETSDAPESSVSNPPGLSVQAYPSPFSLSARVAYRVPNRGNLSIRIYNVRGELVRTLIDEVVESGAGEVIWDGTSDDGRIVASGVYIYSADAAGAVASGTIVLIK